MNEQELKKQIPIKTFTIEELKENKVIIADFYYWKDVYKYIQSQKAKEIEYLEFLLSNRIHKEYSLFEIRSEIEDRIKELKETAKEVLE